MGLILWLAGHCLSTMRVRSQARIMAAAVGIGAVMFVVQLLGFAWVAKE